MSAAARQPLQISPVRHGRPNHYNRRWCNLAQMRDWIDGYNRALVACDGLPDSLTPLAREAAQVLSSPVSRCVQSRRHPVGERHCLSAELFSEAHLRRRGWQAPRLLVLKPYWHASSYRAPAKATTTGP